MTTDRIAYPAFRTAGLLAEIERRGETVDRTGVSGRFCETYPDPALERFALRPAGRFSYKGKEQARTVARSTIVDALRKQLVMDDDTVDLCREWDDALDAIVCALVARAVEKPKTAPPPPESQDEAVTEGWIHLPKDPVSIETLA